jgi:magnesium chelatase subunit D
VSAAAVHWADAVLAAALFAVDSAGTGGVAVRALPGPVRDRWLALLRERLPPPAPVRRVPLHVPDGRLLGGLDLAATLQAGRPVAERGLLAEADGGIVVLPMAERLAPATAARIAAALDSGELVLERDGLALRTTARFGVVALDEGAADDEVPPAALIDRLAFRIDLASVASNDAVDCAPSTEEIAAARERLPSVRTDDAIVEALCGAAMALGIASLRAPLLALRAARAAAALDGRSEISEADAALAARLVLAPRATRLPAPEEPAPEEAESSGDATEDFPAEVDRPLEDRVVEAARGAIPAGLLASLKLGNARRSRSAGRAGALHQSKLRGRPIGARSGEPRAGARLNLVETLRAAAPWQRLRRRGERRIEVRREDFRITRYKQRSETTAIFVVDASGSAALHRLAEAKGAVELLLADCYVRRDRVALVAFRGRGAETLLAPTRSLVRAKRSLAGLPGGGGTPLAGGIDAAAALADAVRRRGGTPVVVFLTDGRANVARDGSGGRPQAEADALAAARTIRVAGLTALLVDTSPQPQPLARQLAAEMDAIYMPLPHADASTLSRAVQATALVPGANTRREIR